MARRHSAKTTKKDINTNQQTQVQCPYCPKAYKTPGFWLTNHLMLKHRKGFDIQTIIIDSVIIAVLINSLFYYGIIDKITGQEPPPVRIEKNQYKLMTAKTLSDLNFSKCSDVTDTFGYNFSNLYCGVEAKSPEIAKETIEFFKEIKKTFLRMPESSNKPELCASNVTVEDGAMLIDNCDIAYKDLKLSDSGYAITINFKPLWRIDESSIHYLFDIINGNNSERNRISLYTQNGYLKYSILNKYGTEEHLIKIDLKNNSGWKEQNFNKIEIGWFGDRMFIDLNGNNNNKVVGNIDLNLNDSFLFLGSNVFGNDQATGYFDYIYVRKYVYPEPTGQVGVTESPPVEKR
ncbi:MAG: hypothetical protein WC556_09055 [Candidatus Methanoperedens sp.]